MGSCEICGRKSDNLIKAIVEGVMIGVCSECSKYGKVVAIRKPLIEPRRSISIKTNDSYESIVENYANLVKTAREKKGMKQDELAKTLAEKESVIQKIEGGNLRPQINLARKLEKFFNIKLIEKLEERKDVSLNLKDSSLTIGDILKLRNRKA
ncbi:TIGR00270 family protein [Candidatus Woesearchaeota archaeon]|nr:TIGR00270 family protein [Candidatus Woesearchaeota archaeon]